MVAGPGSETIVGLRPQPPQTGDDDTMATPAGRPTYGGWLDEIADTGRRDQFGMVAAAWANAKANGRPKLHAVKGVNKWLSEHPPPGVDPEALQSVLHQLDLAYHSQDGLPADQAALTMVPPVQDVPAAEWPVADPAWFDHQHAHQPLAHDGFPEHWHAEDGRAVVLDSEGAPSWASDQAEHPAEVVYYPEQPADQAQQQPAQAAEQPEHPWQVVLLRLGELHALVSALAQGLAPLLQLAAEAQQADAALAASQLAQPSAAQARALEIAQQQGWTTGPAIPQPQQPAQVPAPPDFYGGHVVAPPDFGAMADASDGREDQA